MLLVTAFEKKWEEATLVLIEKGADFAENNAVTIIRLFCQDIVFENICLFDQAGG